MQDDAEDEYFLGSGDGDGDPDEPGDDPRNRRGALIGLAVVVVLVAVAITLTSVLVDTSSGNSAPGIAARKWGDTLVNGDAAARRRLECAAPSDTGGVLVRLLAGGHYRVTTGSAQPRGKDRWSVPLQVDSADGSPVTSADVTVVRESGRYLVC